jgi:DNA-binding HxlR family transcriptional regulator
MVERSTFPAVPPRVEYALTEKGLALIPIIEDMRTYGERWLGAACATEPPAETAAAVAA